MPENKYKRILLKLSGEALAGENKVGIDFTLPYVTLTLGTGMIAFAYAALADFTPRCFIVIPTSGAFAGQEFATRSTIQPTSGYIIFTYCYTFHIQYFLSVCFLPQP